VQDLTSAELSELALLVKMKSSGILFLAGDPAQSVEEDVDFRFEDVRSVSVYELPGTFVLSLLALLAQKFKY
jgi:hypothetical protein